MPRVTSSAVGDPEKFTGDIRTHLMAIDPNQIEQFNFDGTQSHSQLSLNFACRHCHVSGGLATPKSDQELIRAATNYHQVQSVEEPLEAFAPAESVVVEERDGQFVAIVSGNHPDTCSTISTVEQNIEDDTITISVYSETPQDAVCGQALTPFSQEVVLETAGLEPGDYLVDVNNGQTSTSFTIP